MSIFSQVSENVWSTLDLCLKHRINFGEETISDLILLEIEKNNPGTIKTFQTSKADEKHKGTDWEWWIGNATTGWVRYAVQAKKIDKRGKNYNALAHKVGKTKILQHDILKTTAHLIMRLDYMRSTIFIRFLQLLAIGIVPKHTMQKD